jgi:PAS domain S-box-containing protein
MEQEAKKRFRFRLTIGNKILLGFSLLMILYVANVAIIFFTSNTIKKVVSDSSEIIRPSKDAITEFIQMVTRSKMLATNWVYLQTNDSDKKALEDLVLREYPALRDNIKKNLMPKWGSDSLKKEMDSVIMMFETMLQIQESEITSQLVGFEDYEDPMKKFLAEDVVGSKIIPMSAKITEKLNVIAAMQNEITSESDKEISSSVGRLGNVTWIVAGIFIALGMLSAFLIMRSITVPVNFLKNVVVKLGNGELVEDKGTKFGNDEIGEMAIAMDNLVNGLKATTLFAENIGKGNYTSAFKPLSEHDVLGNALINMRDNLAKVAEDDKKRNWATEGMAKFAEILRNNNSDLARLADEIIGSLVKYLKANQGAIYIIDDVDATEEPTMSLKACYAWDKKKFLDHKIHKGEGLAGQAWQEGDTIFLTEVPQNYIKITSGLGDSNPTSVLIVPLKVNDQIFGVVEIAGFNTFRDFEMEFVQKIAESIASTISSVKINARTQRLLEESQEMTEQMRAQEEEMRQNMEELQATQEEMQRSQSETESTMQAIHASLAVAEYDPDGRITKINNNYLDLMGYSQEEVLGEHQRIFATKEEKTSEEFRLFWKDLAAGNPRRGFFTRLNKGGSTLKVYASLSPIKNRSGEVVKVMEIAYKN